MQTSPLRLEIARTWDGTAIDPAEIIGLELTVTGQDLQVAVEAPFHRDPPPKGPPGPTDALWEHEVVELFIAGEGTNYLEIELGPHGHHLVLMLADIRTPAASGLPIKFQATAHGTRWSGLALIPLAYLPPGPHRINATAIHGSGSQRRHLSVCALPGAAADFHQPAHFQISARLT